MAIDKKIAKEFENAVGAEYVSTRPDVLLTYSQTASMAVEPVIPSAVIRPANAKEVSQILKLANKHRIPVTPRSGGSSLQGEAIPKPGGIVVDLLRLGGITLYENLRSVTVGAGVTYGELDKFLAKHGLFLPVYPESSLVCTVAGNVAVNGAGVGSSLYGCTGEMVLGLEVVLPDGTIIQTGSEANPNSPGPFIRYAFGPDLTGLFIGSLGSFGIITKVSVKTFKRMKYFDYNMYGFDTVELAEQFLIEIKQNDINGLFTSIYSGEVLDLFMDMLSEELGFPPFEHAERTVSMTIGRVREDMLESDAKLAREICERLGGRVLNVREMPQQEWEGRFWNFVRASYIHGWHWRTLYHHQTPTNSHKSVDIIMDAMDKYRFLGHTAGFQSGHSSMNLYPHLYFDPQDKDEEEKVVKAHQEIAKALFKSGAVPFKLAEFWKDAIEDMDEYMDFLKHIKNSIDPNNIMNPGVLGGI
ncbi:MAG: FAD-binding oxidoreductase [Candidatus Thorarchaeota archaeon]|nr:FAD-binding oxidoreductase [Candidatus Thorarchaeota archaeon]